MKRLRHHLHGQQLSVGMILWLIVFASLTCTAGVVYAVLKNDQVQVSRDISQMNQEIISCEMTREYYLAKTSSLTGRWAIRDKLKQDQSALQAIEPSAIEYISGDTPAGIVASNN